MATTTMTPGPVLFQEYCDEPEGGVVRSVRFMPLSMQNLKLLWEKSREFDTLFTEEINGDFKKFLELFLRKGPDGIETNGLFWVVDDFVGVFYMTHIVPSVQADVHYTFFDRRHHGRVELVKKMLRYGFLRYNFVRLNAWLPVYVKRNVFKF